MSVNDYIPFDDFVHYGEDLTSGEQIHVNHDKCPAGLDTKRRLYIKRTEDDRYILAYCHNCSLSGRYSIKYGAVKSATTKGKAERDGVSTPYRGTLPKKVQQGAKRVGFYSKIMALKVRNN